MTTQTWLDRHDQAYRFPLDPNEKILVGLMRHIDLLIVNAQGSEPLRPHIVRLLSGFVGLLIDLPSTGRLDKGTLDDWARSRASFVGLTDDDDF